MLDWLRDRIDAVGRSRYRLRHPSAITDTKNGFTGSRRGLKGRVKPPKSKNRWIWAVMAALAVSTVGFAFAFSTSIQEPPRAYDPHSIIIIDGQSELASKALIEGWPGNGSELNPYIIEGYEISTMGHDWGIYVANTSSYITVRECYVYDATVACISLFNVSNISILNTKCTNGQRCIEVTSSRLVSMISCDFTAATEGMRLTACDMITVRGSNCSGNLVGMNALGCGNLTMQFNSAFGNMISAIQMNGARGFLLANNSLAGGQYGVRIAFSESGYLLGSKTRGSSGTGILIESCLGCSIEENVCYGHGGRGISVEDSTACCVRDNEVSFSGDGFAGLGCTDLLVTGNEFRDNHNTGIALEDCQECVVVGNVCERNGEDGLSIQSCDGSLVERNRCDNNTGSGLVCQDGVDCQVGSNTCHGNGDCAIRCQDAVRCVIVGNDLGKSKNGSGLCLSLCSLANVSSNSLNGTGSGIRFFKCDSSIAFNNTVVDCACGISLSESVDITLNENAMVHDGIFIEGPALEHWDSHQIDQSNTVNGRPVAYIVSSEGITVPGTPGQVILVDCLDVTVEGLNLSEVTVGMEMAFCDGVTVGNSTCCGGYTGVYGYSSSSLSVNGTNCSDNVRSGVELVMCTGGELRSMTLRDNQESGVILNASSGVDVSTCEISGGIFGILMEHAASAGAFISNSISNCTEGIRAVASEGLQLSMNDVTSCVYGMRLVNSTGMVMAANAFLGCGLYIESNSSACWDSHSISPDNTVNGKVLAYRVGESDVTLNSTTGQAVVAGCDGVEISSLELSNCTVGVLAGFSSRVSVSDCNLTDNMLGAEMVNCTQCDMISNEVRNCSIAGLGLVGCAGSTVEGNHVSGCAVGISVRDVFTASPDNLVARNNVSGNQDGIVLNRSSEAEVLNNTLLGNNVCAIRVIMSNGVVIWGNMCNGSGDVALSISRSAGCEIINNACSLNKRGICLCSSLDCNVSGNEVLLSREYGICLDRGCSGNAVWGNTLAYNNGTSAEYNSVLAQACDHGFGNRWNASEDSSWLGNYWFDWAGPDADEDGIVDFPYEISGQANARDHRPLAAPPGT